jgi:hypothetical protein
MNANRHRRLREAAIKDEREHRADHVRRVLEEARRNVRGAPGGVCYTEPVETPQPSLVYKIHEPAPDEPVHSEPAAAASHSPGQAGQWDGWEKWLRSHLDNEREVTEAMIKAAITDAARGLVDGTISGFDALDDKVLEINRALREEIRELKHEVVRLTSVADELRKAQTSEPLDLPRLPLRSAREVN